MTAYSATSGHPISNTTLSSGDSLTVAAGGVATGDTDLPGARETVSGTAANETVSGTVITGAVNQPQQLTASLTVAAGGVATGTHVSSGGFLAVFGSATNTTVSGAATLVVNGQSFAALTSAVVYAGGAATTVVVGSGGDVAVDGILHGADVQSGGLLDVFGSADGVLVQAGGNLAVAIGQVTGTVLSGGTETVLGTEGSSAPFATATQVFAGGLVQLTNAGVDSATVLRAGGQEIVDAGGTATNPVISGGTLELATSGGTDGGFSDAMFAGGGGRLVIDDTVAPTGTISGFAIGDSVVFAGLAAGPASLAVSGNTVTLAVDGFTETLTIAGASAIAFQLGIDAATGGESVGVACYCAGTAILTPQGERPVEMLAPGDHVITARGRVKPVLWVGRRSYAGRFLAGQPQLLPIRIRAGALGDGLPHRDLLVSPCHAMLLDGVLVPAALLANGRSIVQDHRATRVDYVHLELDCHDLVVAEGARSETYLDDDSRGLFANAAGHCGPSARGGYCAPRVMDGYGLEAIRRRLAGLVPERFQAA